MLNRCFAVFPLIRLSGVMCREDLMRPFTKRRSLYSNLGKIKLNSKTDQGVENQEWPNGNLWYPVLGSVCGWGDTKRSERQRWAFCPVPSPLPPPILPLPIQVNTLNTDTLKIPKNCVPKLFMNKTEKFNNISFFPLSAIMIFHICFYHQKFVIFIPTKRF